MIRRARSPLLNSPRVLQIAQEEAERANLPVERLLARRVNSPMLQVRNRVWRRIIRETGCNRADLARAWGTTRATIGHALGLKRTPGTQEASIYDLRTITRLYFSHGQDRAAEIVAGRDPDTNDDIAAWRRLGTGRGAA